MKVEEEKFYITPKDLSRFINGLDDLSDGDTAVDEGEFEFGKIITFIRDNEVKTQLVLYKMSAEPAEEISKEQPIQHEEEYRKYLGSVDNKKMLQFLGSKPNYAIVFKVGDELKTVKKILVNHKDKQIILVE